MADLAVAWPVGVSPAWTGEDDQPSAEGNDKASKRPNRRVPASRFVPELEVRHR